MNYLEKIAVNIDVAPVMAQLAAHPELWDANPLRRVYENSPHREMSDIWVRARENTGDGLASYSEPHKSVWWPAAEHLPALAPIASKLMRETGATELGGVLVTKVLPGKQIYPHCDKGFWHAETYRTKVYLCLQGNDDCVVWCEDESAIMKTGEAWKFDNLVMHGLENNGVTDRISAIFAMRKSE